MYDWEQIKRIVELHGDVMTFTMGDLRDAQGAQKLGVHVRSGISDSLADLGLKHIPEKLPTNQDVQLRIYKEDSPVGHLITAVLIPDKLNDLKIRHFFHNERVVYSTGQDNLQTHIAHEARTLCGFSANLPHWTIIEKPLSSVTCRTCQKSARNRGLIE